MAIILAGVLHTAGVSAPEVLAVIDTLLLCSADNPTQHARRVQHIPLPVLVPKPQNFAIKHISK